MELNYIGDCSGTIERLEPRVDGFREKTDSPIAEPFLYARLTEREVAGRVDGHRLCKPSLPSARRVRTGRFRTITLRGKVKRPLVRVCVLSDENMLYSLADVGIEALGHVHSSGSSILKSSLPLDPSSEEGTTD